MISRHVETHRVSRVGWLRAAVLGANDGLISTSSLVIGMIAAGAGSATVMVAGFSGLVAGALSMAAGEYVSVSSQADSEKADLALERRELAANPAAEHRELAGIYVQRGLSPALAAQVATELMRHDALGAHARDELGIVETLRARPVQAALASAAAFSVGASAALAGAALLPDAAPIPWLFAMTLVLLAALGALAANLGGASPLRGALRIAFWGAAAMVCTGLVGRLVDQAVSFAA